MTSIRTRLLVVLALFALGSCAARQSAPAEATSEVLRAGATTVERVGDLPSSALLPDAVLTFEIGRDGAGVDVRLQSSPGEAGFARLFKLPNWTTPYSVTVHSYVEGGIRQPALFYPRVTFLDRNFQPTRHTTQDDFVYRTGGRQGAVVANVFINQSNREEAYVLVTGEPKGSRTERLSAQQSSSDFPVVVPIGPMIVTWHVRIGHGELPTQMRASETGAMQIELKGYVLKKAYE